MFLKCAVELESKAEWPMLVRHVSSKSLVNLVTFTGFVKKEKLIANYSLENDKHCGIKVEPLPVLIKIWSCDDTINIKSLSFTKK